MSRSLFASAISAMMFVWSSGFVMAQQTGTAEEAKAMFDRAVAAVKADEAKALSEFNDKNNKQFHDRDLYVFLLQYVRRQIHGTSKSVRDGGRRSYFEI